MNLLPTGGIVPPGTVPLAKRHAPARSPGEFGRLPSRRRWLIGAALAALAPAASRLRGQAGGPAEGVANAFPLEEPPLEATLWGVDAEGHVTLRTGDKLRVLAADELAYYGCWHETDAGPQILLTDGSCLRADLLAVDDQRVVLGDASGVGRTTWLRGELPRVRVRAVMLQPPAGPRPRDLLVHQITQLAADQDHVWLVGGGSLRGRLQPFVMRNVPATDDGAPEVDTLSLRPSETGPTVTIPLDKVRALTLRQIAPLDAETPPDPLPPRRFWLGLQDGSLVQVREVRARRNPVQLVLATGDTLTLPADLTRGRPFWSWVTYVEPVHSRVTWLSDLEPVGYKHLPFLGASWPLAQDHHVLGGRLRTRDAVYRKGLGMPSASRVAYDTAGQRRFQAELAIDATAGLRGSVVYKVLRQLPDGTWEPAYTSPVVRGGDAPLPITVDCRGAVRIALLVDFGEWAHQGDLANWLMARLIR
jgi:hypothetical protein